MPPPPDTPRENQIPLCVDLDGTLIKTDLLWESLARLLRRNPFQLLPVLFWWARGRAFLKRQLARRVTIDPAALPYHKPFLAYLREQKKAGRRLILATASDRDMALPVANHVGLFDEVLGATVKPTFAAPINSRRSPKNSANAVLTTPAIRPPISPSGAARAKPSSSMPALPF